MAKKQVKHFDGGGGVYGDEYGVSIDDPGFGGEFGDGNAGAGKDISTPPVDPGFYVNTPPSSTYETGITPPSGVYPDPNSPTGYSDGSGNPVKYDPASKIFTGSNGSSLGVGSNTQFGGGGVFSGITKYLNDKLGTNMSNADLLKYLAIGGGGVAGMMGANKPSVTKVGYQGGIPQLQANRSMQLAPPTKAQGYRPGQGGINYGGDVNYTQRAAQGGLMGMAHGGQYLQGNTDGMADKLRTSIDGKQPAALSHGEFVIPADVVSHLGNGNSDAGAKKLYGMMDKIRQARTGTKKQGKEINPDKFMPGGSVGYAAGGGIKGFSGVDGSSVGSAAAAGVTGTEQGLSNYVGPYVTDMLAKGQALANAPYQQYQGPLTAGASDLQNQAFNTAANLQVPGSVGAAAQTAGDIANKAANINYTPTGFTNQFNAPDAGTATNFTNQYQAPTPYQNTNFTSGTFGNEQAQQYMNPYLQQSLNPQLEEARRQAQIDQQLNNASSIKSGGFGGGAGDIMARASQRDLGSKLANITGQGYNTAYTNAMSQFNADQARNMQAQQASEQSKQFGATQGMTAAQMMAQYGMSAQQAQEAARQFQQNQAMTGAQNKAQYGLAANTAAEQSKQFGADLGLKGLNTGLSAAQTQGNLGISGANLGLAQLQEQAQLGNTQRGIESEGIAADKKAFEEARDNPYKMAQFQQSLLNGLPITATNYQMAQPNELQSIVGGATTTADLVKKLKDLGII
jgi:hypothetical protein